MGNAKSKLYPKSKAKRRDSKKQNDFPESSTATKKVDPRLPFTSYRQVFTLRNAWKTVSRDMMNTAKTNLLLFFQQYPHHQALFPKLKDLQNEEQMKESMAFENQAIAIFTLFDETMEYIEALDKAMFGIRTAAKAHSSVPGFDPQFFADMEQTFIEAVSYPLGERFTETLEENFRKFYNFVSGSMIELMKKKSG